MSIKPEKDQDVAMFETPYGKNVFKVVKQLLGGFGSFFEKTIVIILVLLVWELLPKAGLVDPFLLPPFSDVIKALVELIKSGELLKHILASFERSFSGFLLATAFAVPMGIFMGWFKRVEWIANPLLEVGRNTPVLALYPVFILFFGLGETSKLAIIIFGTLWPILLNTIQGVKDVEPILIKSARSMGVSQLTMLRKVVLPSATPSIITGLRLGASNAILLLVAAEMLNANAGLGFMIFYYENNYAIPFMFSGLITLAFVGVLVNYLLVRVEKKFTRWKQEITN